MDKVKYRINRSDANDPEEDEEHIERSDNRVKPEKNVSIEKPRKAHGMAPARKKAEDKYMDSEKRIMHDAKTIPSKITGTMSDPSKVLDE